MWNQKVWCALLALPMVMHALSTGAPVRRTGAPIDGGLDCTACHRTFAPANSDVRGFVRIHAVNYTPGKKQTIRVQIYHPEAMRWGFSLTSRLTSNENLKAGTFTPNTNVQVRCDPGANAPCGQDREFATHQQAATTLGANGLHTYAVEWTPPDNASGDVVFYAAGNAANNGEGNGGDRIYTTSLKISQAPALATPVLQSDGAVSAQAFGGSRTISPGTWMELFGANMTNVTREWATWDFTGANAPTSLEGVTVTIGGKDAFVRFVSPRQVNVQVPDGIGVGPVTVVVKNEAGNSSAATLTAAARSPGVLSPPSFLINNRQLAVALLPDNTTFVARAGEIAGITSRPARVGETITLYMIGGGATTPAVAAGTVAPGLAALASPVVRFGDAPATVSYAGLAPGAVGLYQFNVVVPNVAAGDVRLSISIDGVTVAQELTTVIGN